MNRLTMLTPALLVLVACEAEPLNDVGNVGDTGGASSGGTATGGANTGGTPESGGSAGSDSSGGASTGGTGTGGSGGDDCAAYEDATGWSVQVLIRNDSSQTIHLGQTDVTCGVRPLFTVEDAAGTVVDEHRDCNYSCGDMLMGRLTGCPLLCAYPQAITLAPFEAAEQIWSGLHSVDVTVPDACVPAGEPAPASCALVEQIEPGGKFTFRAVAGTGIDCTETIGECAACEPNENSGCTTSAAVITGATLTAEATVTLGPSYGVGPVNGGGALMPVELSFTD